MRIIGNGLIAKLLVISAAQFLKNNYNNNNQNNFKIIWIKAETPVTERYLALSDSSIQLFKHLNLYTKIVPHLNLINDFVLYFTKNDIKNINNINNKNQTVQIFGENHPKNHLAAMVNTAILHKICDEALADLNNYYDIQSIGNFELNNNDNINNDNINIITDKSYQQIKSQKNIQKDIQNHIQINSVPKRNHGRAYGCIIYQNNNLQNIKTKQIAYQWFDEQEIIALLPIQIKINNYNQNAYQVVLSTTHIYPNFKTLRLRLNALINSDAELAKTLNNFNILEENINLNNSPAAAPIASFYLKQLIYKNLNNNSNNLEIDNNLKANNNLENNLNYLNNKFLIIGEAAHQIHPLAGQGLNLGIRDVLDLLPYLPFLFNQKINQAANLQLNRKLNAYQQKRLLDIYFFYQLTTQLDYLNKNTNILNPLNILKNFKISKISKINLLQKIIISFAK